MKITVGAQSTLGRGKTFLLGNYAWKINKIPECYVIGLNTRKIIKMPEFLSYLPKTKFPKITKYLPQNARILHVRKIFFPNFRGVGHVPTLPPSFKNSSVKAVLSFSQNALKRLATGLRHGSTEKAYSAPSDFLAVLRDGVW